MIEDTIDKLLDLNLPILLWGPPGVGKSTMIRKIVRNKGWKLIDLRLSQMSPVDLRGIPVPDHQTGRTKWYPPAELPDAKRDGEYGVLFLDELLQAPRDVQAAALQLVLDRKLGEYELPPNWRVVAASNRVTDKAGTYQIISSLANRFIHIPIASTLPTLDVSSGDVSVDLDAWKTWAYESGVAEEVVAFLNYKPDMLWKATGQVAYPTPRMWGDYVSRIIKEVGMDRKAIMGCIGEGPATEFVAFCELRKSMPDPDDILEGKEAPVPDRPDVTYALCGALVSRIVNAKKRASKKYPGMTSNLMKYIIKLPVEFQVLTLRDICRTGASDALVSLPEFSAWLKNNKDVFIS